MLFVDEDIQLRHQVHGYQCNKWMQRNSQDKWRDIETVFRRECKGPDITYEAKASLQFYILHIKYNIRYAYTDPPT